MKNGNRTKERTAFIKNFYISHNIPWNCIVIDQSGCFKQVNRAMWIIVFLVCLGVIRTNNAQELTHSATGSVITVNGANSTKSPVTLTIQNERSGSEKSNEPVNVNYDFPLFYSNPWQPLITPIGFDSIDNNDNRKEVTNEYSFERQFAPTELRRPYLETNNTVPYTIDEQPDHRSEIPIPGIFYYMPVPNSTAGPVVSYTEHVNSGTPREENIPVVDTNVRSFNLYRNTHVPQTPPTYYPTHLEGFSDLVDGGVNDKNEQLLPTSASKPVASNLKVSSEKDDSTLSVRIISPPDEPFQPHNINRNKTSSKPELSSPSGPSSEAIPNANISGFPERPQPARFYRNSQRLMPPIIPVFFPQHPFIPFSGDGVFPRKVIRSGATILLPPTYPNFNRNAKSISSAERSGHIEQETPTKTSNGPPSHPLPFPPGGFPFRILPEPFLPPWMPNAPGPSRFPLNPIYFPHFRGIPRNNGRDEPLVTIPSRAVQNATPDIITAQNGDTRLPVDVLVTPQEVIPVANSDAIKIPYAFGFDMNDGKGTDQHRKEVSDAAGVVTGSYGYRDAFGVFRLVNYFADKNGFRAFIKSNEPGVANSGSADVVVVAERPPPGAVAKGIKVTEPDVLTISNETTDPLTIEAKVEPI